MWIADLHHTEMAKQLAMLRAAFSSAAKFVLRWSPTEAFWVEVVDELATEFQKSEEQRYHLEKPDVRLYDLILGAPSDRARLANWLGAEQATQQEADTEQEALWSSATRVCDLVLKRADEPSSFVASLSWMVELLQDRIDAAAANGVCWSTWSALAITLLHFLELGTELELLGSRRNADLT
jgi:hypothetical protein